MNGHKKPDKKWVLVIYLLCVSLLFGLGAWQLSRGLEKRELESRLVSVNSIPTPDLERAENLLELEYQTVSATGKWDQSRVILLDNRIYRGQPGFEVFVPFILGDKASIVLCNLGWLNKARVNDLQSVVSAQTKENSVTGQLYFPEKGFTLGESVPRAGNWPVIVQALDFDGLREIFSETVLSAVIVSESSEELVKIWQPAVLNSTRHYGYTLQWWGLTVVLLVFGVIWNRKLSTSEYEH